jgi:phosphoribosylformimino-5-aminoimidazole carboxamide ribonucleotide (ProFAR) isomerase
VQLYPALDLRGGVLARAAVPGADPLTFARSWRAAGATWIHVVDLDRALGTGDNTPLVRRLVSEVEPPLQVGGAPTTAAAIEEVLGWGATRVVAGVGATSALAGLVRQHGADRLAVALDVQNGMAVTLDGAQAGNPLDLLASIWDAGVRTVGMARSAGLHSALLASWWDAGWTSCWPVGSPRSTSCVRHGTVGSPASSLGGPCWRNTSVSRMH